MIRKANNNDIKQIISLYLELDIDAVSFQPKNYKAIIKNEDFINKIINDEKSFFYVCEIDSRIIGFIYSQEKTIPDIGSLKPAKFIYIYDLIVSENFRNLQYGKKLLNKIVECGKANNSDYIRVSVLAEKKLSKDFYIKNNFKESQITLEYRINEGSC